MGRVTAVFDNQAEAEEAISELRDLNVANAELSFLTRHGDLEAERAADDMALGAGRGLLGGMGIGAVFGLLSSMVPTVGLFITAGWLAAWVGPVYGSILAGAMVGSIIGFVAGAIARAGYSHAIEKHFGAGVEPGNVMVAVDTNERSLTVSPERVSTIMANHHGRIYGY
jgi:uncharacterized membrane protein